MPRQNAFVKVSGDRLNDEKFFEWTKEIAREYYVVICVGGGTQINEAFEKAGFPVGIHGPLGRETKTLEERQLARNVLEKNQAQLQDALAERNIPATVIIPVLILGDVLCHVNGDKMTEAAYHGFDKLFIITTPERAGAKQEELQDLPKIEVVGL